MGQDLGTREQGTLGIINRVQWNETSHVLFQRGQTKQELRRETGILWCPYFPCLIIIMAYYNAAKKPHFWGMQKALFFWPDSSNIVFPIQHLSHLSPIVT